jgi:Ca-activated chloride channel homolog
MGRIAQTLAVVFALSAIGRAQEAPPPIFREQVKLVHLIVSVKDANGAPVGTLQKNDFRVFDNGAEQRIAVFEHHSDVPLSVCVLIDISGSTAIDLRYETQSITRFLRALLREGNPDDRAALFSFNWEVTLNVGFTHRILRLEQALRGLHPEGGTSLYDALYLASGRIEDREGRHVMIVVTDGGDTTSAKTYQDALEAVQSADAVLYPILVMPITNDAGRNIGGENALTTLAAGTGGRVFAPSIGAEMDSAFDEILRDLRTQYLIGYYPKNVPLTSNRFHRVRVLTTRPGLRVETRSGYYGDAEGQTGRSENRNSEIQAETSRADVRGGQVPPLPLGSRHSDPR